MDAMYVGSCFIHILFHDVPFDQIPLPFSPGASLLNDNHPSLIMKTNNCCIPLFLPEPEEEPAAKRPKCEETTD